MRRAASFLCGLRSLMGRVSVIGNAEGSAGRSLSKEIGEVWTKIGRRNAEHAGNHREVAHRDGLPTVDGLREKIEFMCKPLGEVRLAPEICVYVEGRGRGLSDGHGSPVRSLRVKPNGVWGGYGPGSKVPREPRLGDPTPGRNYAFAAPTGSPVPLNALWLAVSVRMR